MSHPYVSFHIDSYSKERCLLCCEECRYEGMKLPVMQESDRSPTWIYDKFSIARKVNVKLAPPCLLGYILLPVPIISTFSHSSSYLQSKRIFTLPEIMPSGFSGHGKISLPEHQHFDTKRYQSWRLYAQNARQDLASTAPPRNERLLTMT